MAKRGAKSAPDTTDGGNVVLEPKPKRGRKPRVVKGTSAAATIATPEIAAAAAEAVATTTEAELVVAAPSKTRSKTKQSSGKDVASSKSALATSAISTVPIATTAAASSTVAVATTIPTPPTKEQFCIGISLVVIHVGSRG